MTRYAEATSVSSDRSRAEIERILARYGAFTHTPTRGNRRSDSQIEGARHE